MTSAARPSVRQERDHVSRAVIYGGALVLAVILTCGWFFAWLGGRHAPIHTGFRRTEAPVTTLPREIDMVDQTLFSAGLPSRGDWTTKRRDLESYRWVDRRQRLATIPIDRAMQMLVERGHVE
jgi:hypothetical protein